MRAVFPRMGCGEREGEEESERQSGRRKSEKVEPSELPCGRRPTVPR